MKAEDFLDAPVNALTAEEFLDAPDEEDKGLFDRAKDSIAEYAVNKIKEGKGLPTVMDFATIPGKAALSMAGGVVQKGLDVFTDLNTEIPFTDKTTGEVSSDIAKFQQRVDEQIARTGPYGTVGNIATQIGLAGAATPAKVANWFTKGGLLTRTVKFLGGSSIGGGLGAFLQPSSKIDKQERMQEAEQNAKTGAILGPAAGVVIGTALGAAPLAKRITNYVNPAKRLAVNVGEDLGERSGEVISNLETSIQRSKELQEKGIDYKPLTVDAAGSPNLLEMDKYVRGVGKTENQAGTKINPNAEFINRRVENETELKKLVEPYDRGVSESGLKEYAEKTANEQLDIVNSTYRLAEEAANGSAKARAELAKQIDTTGLSPEAASQKVDSAIKDALAVGKDLKNAPYEEVIRTGANLNNVDIANNTKRLIKDGGKPVENIIKTFNATNYSPDAKFNVQIPTQPGKLSADEAVRLNARLGLAIKEARTSGTPAQVDVLKNVQDSVKNVLKTNTKTSEVFNKANDNYLSWRKQYMERPTGNPTELAKFSNELSVGNKVLSPSKTAKRFVNAANPEAFDDLQRAMGTDADALGEDVIMSDLRKHFEGKDLNKRDFDTFMNDNKTLFDRLPQTKAKLDAIRTKLDQAGDPKEAAKMLSDAQEAAEKVREKVLNTVAGKILKGDKTPERILKDSLANRKVMAETIKLANNSPVGKEALIQSFYNHIVKANAEKLPNGGIKYNPTRIRNAIQPGSESEASLKMLIGEDGVEGLRTFDNLLNENSYSKNVNLSGQARDAISNLAPDVTAGKVAGQFMYGSNKANAVVNLLRQITSTEYNKLVYKAMTEPEEFLRIAKLGDDSAAKIKALDELVRSVRNYGTTATVLNQTKENNSLRDKPENFKPIDVEMQNLQENKKAPVIKPKKLELNSNDPIKKKIGEVSKKYGVSQKLLTNIANAESALGKQTKNPNSSATGVYQFTQGTWEDMVKKYGQETGITEKDINDPEANIVMGALFIKDNKENVKKILGRNPSQEEVYMAHFLGNDGVKKLFKNYGEKNAVTLFPEQAKVNKDKFYDANGRPRTTKELYQALSDYYRKKIVA